MRIAGSQPVSRAVGVLARIVLAAIALFAATANAADDSSGQEAKLTPLVAGVWIAGQVTPQQVEGFAARGMTAVVDLRPDDEEPGQPSSQQIGAAAERAGLSFAYAPVEGGQPSQAAVDAVSRAILRPDTTVVVYCRSGRRAARTWALAEASRTGGLEAEAIEAAAKSAGQPVDDLREQIAARIATRVKLP
ncbi:TIGR01244 family sulfur transferase [Dokdonella sp.]|uniref:TIGR01244 family sulfur transferase n=1 Tax=Dokdonella sp. TaxID=2291710 RepID=UPI0026163E2C|nr:TIGR01244 family sulfur transferase [Dokdonella sp.]